MIEGRGLSYRIGGHAILSEVDIVAATGEVLALVGPNGAGKSTLLALLAVDLAPTGGEVRIDGRLVRGMRPGGLAALRSVMPQQTQLQFAFTAAEVVSLGRRGRGGRGGRDVGAAVTTALSRVDAVELAHRSFPTLSGGEQARVTLARVIAQDAPVVLLDEPTAHLDLRHQRLVLQVVQDLAAEGRAVVVVLHDVNLAARWADRVMVLAQGRVAAVGTPAETLTATILSEVYRHPIEVVDHPTRGGPLALPS